MNGHAATNRNLGRLMKIQRWLVSHAEVEAKNAAIEAGRIALMEQLKIRNWQAGKDMLDAWIEVLEAQGASPEQIAALKEQGATQGFGTAHLNAATLSQILSLQNAFVNSSKPLLSPTPDDDLPPSTQPALDWLIALYENEELPGDTVLERTQFILDATKSGLFLHFANIPEGDSGFNPAFQDSKQWPSSGNQVGHFLTALDLSIWANDPSISQVARPFRYQFALNAIIGHELIGDNVGTFPIIINSNQVLTGFYYNLTTFGALNRWFLSGEEANFQKIIDMGPHVFGIKVTSFTSGNSIEDIRLSYQGWSAGEQISNGNISTLQDFAQWLKDNLK
ncbi:MAG TPA: hypothetical protein VNJ29_02860 [Candidatus Nitrosotenuis sp.]|nr:hypothetical protein [Candidatus Nitrosotenuis sp.]